jgi:predicted dehydrogenase
MSAALGWGLLGTAHINRRLIPAMRAARRSAVTAVASRNASRARDYAREWAIPVAHESYDALLRDRSVDAIYIPLPNALHVEWILRALDAGKHVLCEKPLALTADDVDRVDAVARDRQRVVAEAFMFRHEPLTARVLDLLDDGIIGSLQAIDSGFTFMRTRTPDVRLDPTLGGGSLWDIGCYAVNAVRLVARAEPTKVSGAATNTSTGVDDAFAGMLQFESGLLATIHSSFRTSYRTWLEVSGAGGTLRINNFFKPGPREIIEVHRDEQEVEKVTVDGSPLLFVRQIDDFVAAALDGRSPAVSLRETRGNAAVLAALHESARTGHTVQL